MGMAEKTTPDKLPKIFYVNWFRRDEDGNFMWPGFGENSRVLKWMVERLEGKVGAVDSPAGLLPVEGELDVEGLDIDPEVLREVTGYKAQEWKDELPRMRRWVRSLGRKVPREIHDQMWHLALSLLDSKDADNFK